MGIANAELLQAMANFKPEPVTIVLQPVTAAQIEELRTIQQLAMPKGWVIRLICELDGEHHHLIAYRLSARIGDRTHLLFIGPEGQGTFPAGWSVEWINRAFYNELRITAPDGQSVMIDDCLLA